MVLTPLFHRCRAKGVQIKVENFVKHLFIGLVRGGLEQIPVVAPERVHEQHRAQHPPRDRRIDVAEFAAADAALDDTGDQPPDTLDDFTAIEACEIGIGIGQQADGGIGCNP